MNPKTGPEVSVADVLDRIRLEITRPASGAAGSSPSAKVTRVRALQREFRREPVGGRLLPLKKVLYWFVASSFDRQAKVVEALLDVVDDLALEVEGADYRSPNPAESGRLRQDDGRRHGDSWGVGIRRRMPAHGPGHAAGLSAVLGVDAEMLEPERVLLYGLVFGLKPLYCLEIGTFRGGSSSIICRAMDDSGCGRLVCVDPEPRITDHTWNSIQHRAMLIKGTSPQALADARRAINGELFDLALIDGDHSYEGALKDIEGCLEHLGNGAHIVLHDCHFFAVRDAIREALRRFSDVLVDCGVVSVSDKPEDGENAVVDGKPVVWGGLHLLRVVRPGVWEARPPVLET
jgi:predicted O-methyltransferase YrrM